MIFRGVLNRVTPFISMSCIVLFATFSRAQDTDAALEALAASSDSMYTSSLNADPDEESLDSLALDDSEEGAGRTAQQIFEENPHYTMRQYNHKQQVVVGSVIMFCVALAMVAMNNYNPKH